MTQKSYHIQTKNYHIYTHKKLIYNEKTRDIGNHILGIMPSKKTLSLYQENTILV